MSNEGSSGEHLSTTTVSSVAVQAGDSRIVIAILKCGKWVQLQLTESIPNVLEIGSNQDETKKLLQDHELLLAKLKSLEDQVWDLLREADKTAEENKEQSQVYDAMAQTLGDAWDALIIMLEKRRALLKLTAVFFENALEFAIKIDQVEDFLRNAQEFENTESLKKLLHQHEHHTKELLEKSLALLNKSHELTEFIEEFKSDGPNVNPELIQGAHSSCLKIGSLLELLQDRRRQLDKYLKQQCQGLEQVLQICHWHHQENQVTSWYRKNMSDYLHKQNLGSSLTENEELLHEHMEMEFKAKEWNSTVEKLKAEALKILFSEDYAEKEHLKLSNQKINLLQEELCHRMEERKTLLQEANDFFSAANKAFDVLGGIEAYLKLLNSEGLSLPILAMKHEELQGEIKDCTADALQKGKALVSKGDSHSSWMTGIQEMIEYVQKRVDQLIRQCPAYKELALKKQGLTASLEDYLKKVSLSIKKVSPILEISMDPGSCLTESEKVLNEYLELSNQAKETSHELEAAVRIINEVEEFEPAEVAAFSSKADLLNEELTTLNKNISSKLDVLKAYVAFLKSAKEVNDQAQSLKEFYKSEPVQTESEAENKTVIESADTQWPIVLKKILSTQDMGHDFINSLNMVNKNFILKLENVVQVTEDTIDKLNREKEELTDLWTTWKLHVNQEKSIKQQCWKFKEQFKKTTHNLMILEEALRPAAVDLGSNLQIFLELQQKFNQMKQQFQQLTAEVEYTVKLSELLTLKGVPVKENSEKVSELTDLYQRIKERMTEYDEIFNKSVKFHHVKEQLECLKKSGELEIPETSEIPDDAHQARVHLANTQEKYAHIGHLYKLALTLGVDSLSAVQHPNCFNISVKTLQQELATLECDSINWRTKADKYEEELSHNCQYCTSREEINELRESFKDLKKKFNNLKFNYTKKTEKARNLKVLKIQIQQVEMYAEKMQILRKKMDNLEKKVTGCVINHPDGKAGVLLESVNELQKQLSEFGRVVEDYKQNLDRIEHLQQMMEECQFWYEEASATVVRVGKYSAECKTREAVAILYKQFNKFIKPMVPQQEERIQQITDLAKHLYGFEEGRKYIERTIKRHKEVLDSIDELCISLRELEEQIVEETRLADISVVCPAGEDFVSQDMALAPSAKEDSLQAELLAEETPSSEEYKCRSSDDSSWPLLSEMPESDLLHSEAELGEQPCCSSPSLHVSSCSLQTQINSGSKGMTDESDLLTPVAYADTSNHRRETTSDELERLFPSTIDHYPKFGMESPLTCSSPAVPENITASCTIHAKPACSMISEVRERHIQHNEAHQSMTETQEQLHDINNFTKTQDRLHALPDAFSGLMFQSDTTRSCQRQMVTQQEIKSASEKNSMASLSGQAPNFSKLLSNVTVMEGSPVTLEVEVAGFPEPSLTWRGTDTQRAALDPQRYKKGQKLTADEHLKLLQKETKHALFIQKVCDADAGLYVVRAKNSSGTISSSAILHVKVQGKQPNFIQKFGHTTLQEGEDLILHCTIHGIPRPNVVWTKDDIRLVAGNISIEKLGDSYYLLKRNVVLADTGKYICVASNEVGEAYCSAFIRVTEKNEKPEIPTETETKSKQEQGYFSEKMTVPTTEVGQGQDAYCMKGQRPMANHLSVRLKHEQWLQSAYFSHVESQEVNISLKHDPILLLASPEDIIGEI
ncbi:coiled-coil domain-containing protein 141 isoform X3 [Malaclemys terrapin pileata]|uniref:coiled-coil domain-containing protein 141 isoform X3 n=1 Tax=Malaclemys terrapin pileata TaxID=2991368 RepID=UPI0023A7DEDC|nr:coiled-coil domain-containing protein 141 isoform X3 [Malaclemys terrapin pileata]